jgi:uncharacterized membrane protein
MNALLMVGALLGAGYAVLLPPLQGPDEFTHFYRAYGISEGSCIAPTLTRIPFSITEMNAAFPPNLEQQRRIGSGDIVSFLRKPLSDSRQDGVMNEAANMYSCFPYVPSTLAIGTGRILGASPAGLLYFSRLANLIAYLGIVYLALRQLPGFQTPLLALAMMPMALNQAASASGDGVAYATAFFLCAYIVRLAWDPHISVLQRRHYLTLGGAIVLAALCKADAWLVPLLILVPAGKFGSLRNKWAVVSGGVLLAIVVIAGWNYVNRADMVRWVEHVKDGRQIYLSENLAFLWQHPWIFFQTFLRTWGLHGRDFAAEFVGRLGWMAVVLPGWCIGLYLLLLGLAAVTDAWEIRLTAGQRLMCLGVAAAAMISVFVGMWCAETTRAHKDAILQSGGYIAGVQGRYFIPFALPLLLGISNGRWRVQRKWLLALAAVTILTVNAVALEKIRSTYYVSADMGPYENKLVRRAGPSAEDAKVFLVRGGTRHWIIFGSWVEKHGYRWDDMQIISPEQFNAIPEGKAIIEQ